MAAILNSAILDSTILHKTLTQTNSIWLKLIYSHLTWWWQPSSIWPSWIQPSCIQTPCYLLSFSSHTHSHLSRMVPTICTKKLNQISLPTICTKKLHSFILTQLDDGSHLEFYHVELRHCHLGFRNLVIFSQIHSKTLSLHSDSESN